MTCFSRMIGASIGGVTKTFWFPATHNFPNVEGYVKSDHMSVGTEKSLPVLLEDLLERKTVWADGFHDGWEFTP